MFVSRMYKVELFCTRASGLIEDSKRQTQMSYVSNSINHINVLYAFWLYIMPLHCGFTGEGLET